jgi:hypothetical protein
MAFRSAAVERVGGRHGILLFPSLPLFPSSSFAAWSGAVLRLLAGRRLTPSGHAGHYSILFSAGALL